MSIAIDPSKLASSLAARGASDADLAVAAGVSEKTVWSARNGRPVKPSTARRLEAGLHKLPVLELTTRVAE